MLIFVDLFDMIQLVIKMGIFQNIIVTDIKKLFVVSSEAGRKGSVVDRTFYGLSLCQSGQITYTMNGKCYVSKPGIAVLLPKGGTYTLHGDKEGVFPVVNFQCRNLHCTEIREFPLQDPDVCIELFEDVKMLCLQQEDRLKAFAAFYKLLSCVDSDKDARPLRFLTKHIEKHFADPGLSNTVLAEKMGISEVYLRKLFKTYYNQTPKQYILDIRMRHARQLLTETALSVTEISERCGFGSVYHFCRAFKEKTGQTPTEFARAHAFFQI